MTTMNISLPDNLKSYVDAQVQAGGYSTSSEYIRELIRQDQKTRQEQRLLTLWEEGIASGSGKLQDMEAIKREARNRLKKN